MKALFTLLFIFQAAAGFAQPTKQFPRKEDREKFYQDLVVKYNSVPVREIWNSDTQNLFDEYVDGHTELELVNSFSTVIHELLHGFNTSEDGGYFYFVEPGIRCFVKEGKYFSSKELNTYVRKGIQDSVFRYQLYIGANQEAIGPGGKPQSGRFEEPGVSVIKGIYGLLEEYNAYYYGSLAAYESYPYYVKTFGEEDEDGMKDYKHEVLGDILAYYEFHLFFGWYMNYAKGKHPDVYQDILSNKPLRVVFTLLESKFSQLVKNAMERIEAINEKIGPDMMEVLDFSGSDEDVFRFLEAAGMDPSMIYKVESKVVNGKTVQVKKCIMDKENFDAMKSEYLSITEQLKEMLGSEKMLFYTQTMKNIGYLKGLMTPEIEGAIESLRIKGVTTQNYEGYLK